MSAPMPDRQSFGLIVFDFDGTLCDSANVKTEAFYLLYLDDYGPEFAARFRDYHLDNAGISRYDKIRHVEAEWLGNQPTDESVDAIADRYSGIVEEAVVAAPLFDGVRAFLAQDHPGVRFTLASATPTDELRRIANRKDIAEFFDAIEGSPRSKQAILEEYLTDYGMQSDDVVMIGDQPSDLDAARAVGTEALAIAPPSPWIAPFPRVDTFAAAADWLTARFPRT